MEINRTDPGMHCLFFPAFRPEFALNSTFIAFGEVFSIFFMQRWGKLYARLMLNHSDGERDVTGEVYVQYSYDFEKQRAAKVWEFILDIIVTCKSPEEIPTLEELRLQVKQSGLL